MCENGVLWHKNFVWEKLIMCLLITQMQIPRLAGILQQTENIYIFERTGPRD